MKTLITGGRGYVGTVVTHLLQTSGHHVDVLTRGTSTNNAPEGARAIVADLRDSDLIHRVIFRGNYDAIIHLASPPNGRTSFIDPLTFFDVIVGGTRNLLAPFGTTAHINKPIFVYASTNAIYGSAHVGHLTETDVSHPESPYAAAKLAAEQVIDTYAAASDLAAVTLRIFNVAGAAYGSHDPEPLRILPRILRAAKHHEDITVNGDGSAVRDFVHVHDVAEAITQALESATPGHQIYNVGSGTGTSILDLIRATETITGQSIRTVHNPPQPEPPALIANTTRAREILKWNPQRSDIATIIK